MLARECDQLGKEHVLDLVELILDRITVDEAAALGSMPMQILNRIKFFK